MDKMYIKIEQYLKKNFPGKHLKLTSDLEENDFGVEIYGINSIEILTKSIGNVLYYKALQTR